MDYSIEILFGNNEQFADFLDQKIKEFNNEHSVHHKEKRKEGAIRPINIIVSDDEGNWIGGLHADVYWDWIHVNDFGFAMITEVKV